jgi:hypothetical protein
MKLTKKRLKEIIREELINESPEGRAQMHAKGLSKDALRVVSSLKKGDIDKARYFIKDIIDSLKEVEKYTRKNDAAYLSLKKGPLKFTEEKLNERLSGKTVTWQIRTQERRTAKKVLDKLKLKIGKDYDFKFISNTFALELLKKHENKVLELFIKNRINVN